MNYLDQKDEVVISNEYDYSNIIAELESIVYLVQYFDSVHNQMLKLYKEDELKNERLSYEYKNYEYKNHFSKLEVYVREKSYNYLSYSNYNSFLSAVEKGQIKNVDSIEISLSLNFMRGTNESSSIHENLFKINFKPYDIIFMRKSNYDDQGMDQIEVNINEILKKFKTTNSIFCSK